MTYDTYHHKKEEIEKQETELVPQLFGDKDTIYSPVMAPKGFNWRQCEGVVLDFLVENNINASVLMKEVEKFTKVTGIHVNIRSMDFDTLVERMNMEFISKTSQYELLYVDPYQFLTRFSNQLEDLNRFQNDDKLPHIVGGIESFNSNYVDICSYFIDKDKLYAIPFDTTSMIFYYRKDIFEKYKCEFCKSGKYNLCPDVEFLATPPYHGCLENYIAYPENMAFKLPDNISTKEGALIEPLAVGMHAAAQGNVKLGNSVVILGAGCIGLVTLLACKAYGATDITVVDVLQKRLDVAMKLGATRVINAANENTLEAYSKINSKGADVVIETAGSKITIQQTAHIVKTGGTIVLVGMAPEDIIDYNFAKILAKEAEIKSVFRYRNIYPKAIQAVAQGLIDVSGIVTHEFEFEKTPEAFQYVINNKQDVVKAVIKID